MENIHTWTVRFIKANGRKIDNMGLVENPGLMELVIMGHMKLARSTGRENSYGLMDLSIKVNFRTTIFTVMEHIFGLTSVNT